MEHLQLLFEKVTTYQLLSIITIYFFTFYEIKRLKQMRANKYFIQGFVVRSICMICSFLFISYGWTFLFSFISISVVVLFKGNFYYNEMIWDKKEVRTLQIPIPRSKGGQICLWFIIDIFAYFFWMIFIPQVLYFLIPKDFILFSKLF